ncbi:MAG: NAD-dependent epimerase/dehydratase family protein [Proteobacteria bacterium]|nr:NAD-dependent epimerase/dehydratase family protein [Pseudomonadota bacterium]NBP13750.1 NAD-dependent epimerase/dehydratase family protein [bacterium]
MTILVTGAFGLLGCAIQKIVAQDPECNPKDFYYLSRSDCDLRDRNQVIQLFQRIKPRVVIHLASHVGGVYDNMNNNLKYLLENTDINNNIVRACGEFGVTRLVNILSTCIFPDYPQVHYPLTSEQLHNGLPHFSNIGYAYSKRLLHVASKILADTSTTQVINLIPTNLYGENDNYNIVSGHVIPALIHKTYLAKQSNGTLYIKGSGEAHRQFVYADDLARVILHFVKSTIVLKQVSCVVCPPESESVSIKQVVDLIASEMKFTGRIQYDGESSDGQLKKTASHHELEQYIPDFQFTPLLEGLQKTCRFFERNNYLLRK